MVNENSPGGEHRRMSKSQLSERMHALQASETQDTDVLEVLHETEVYQIELEMQNRELRDSQQAREEALDRYVNLYDFAPNGYVTLDGKGLIKDINLTLAAMLGVERRGLIGRPLTPWILPAHLRLYRSHMKRCLTEEGTLTAEFRLVRKDKTTFPVEFSTKRPMDAASEQNLFLIAIIDISARKTAEEERENSQNRLRHSEHSLREAVTKLEYERELRERFVSTLTHDLGTPLAAVKISSQIILKRPENIETNQRLAARILTNIERMSYMIDDLLDANRINAGESLPLKRENCELCALIKKTLDGLSAIHGNRFLFKATEQCPAYVEPMAIGRVLENLCNNAVKYGDPVAPILVTIERSRQKILLSVHNEGAAIPAHDQATLFNPFQRTAAAQASGKKGWGIGLTLVRGIIESHGGLISLMSADGVGTTFTVELPRAEDCGSAHETREI